jgi:hypothetical protein
MSYPLSIVVTASDAAAKYTVKSTDWGTGVFPALPSVSANSSADVIIVVTKRFKVQRPVEYGRPAGTADPGGISIAAVDCIAPASVGAPPRIRIRFSNSTAGALTPATQQYDFYQF